jgi:hypothetical protein
MGKTIYAHNVLEKLQHNRDFTAPYHDKTWGTLQRIYAGVESAHLKLSMRSNLSSQGPSVSWNL